MSRRLAALLLVLFAAGCGGPDDSPDSPGPLPDSSPPPAEPGPFGLAVEPAIRVTGDPTGVIVTLRRAADPAEVLPAFADPEAGPGPDTAWEEIFSGCAGADGGVLLPVLLTGLYEIVAVRDGTTKRSFLTVTDLLLHVERSVDEILVFAADPGTGRPLTGAAVVAAGPEVRIEGAADATGVFRRGLAPGRPVAILVRDGDHLGVAVVAAVDPPPATPDLFVETDRSEARPGETVRFAALRRRPDGPPPDRFEVTDEHGVRLAEGAVEDGAGSFRVPPEARIGIATLALRGEGVRGRATVRVLPGEAPPLALGLRVPERAVREDRVPAEFAATFAGAVPAAGATVRYRAWRDGKPGVPALEGEAVLDAAGTLRTHFVPMEAGEWILSAVAEDATGATATAERRIAVRAAEFELRLRPETRWIRAGTPLSAGLDVLFPDGNARMVMVETRPGPEPMPIGAEPGGDHTTFFHDLPPGPVTLTATATDDAGRGTRAEATVRVVDGDDGVGPAEIVVVPDRESYAPGDTARVLVLLPFALEGASILETIAAARLGPHAVETVSGRVHVFEARIPPGIGERVTFAVTAVADRELRRGAATAIVGPGDGALRVEIAAGVDREEGPHAVVRVTTDSGDPVAARAVVRLIAGGAPVALHGGLRIPPEGLRIPVPELGDPRGGRVEIRVATPDGRTATARADVPPSRPGLLRLILPSFLVSGDVAIVRVAAGPRGDRDVPGELRFETEGLLTLSPVAVPLALPAGGESAEAELTASARRPGRARVRAELTAGGEPATEAGEIEVLPRARFREDTRAGATEDGRGLAYMEVPSGFSPDASSLTLHLGAGPLAAAIRAIAGAPPFVEGDAEEVLGSFLPAALAASLLEEWAVELPPELAGHEVRTREGLVALAGRQHADGGFGAGPGGASDPATTARVVSALALLGKTGVDTSGPDLPAAVGRLRAALAAGPARLDPVATALAVIALSDATGDPGDDLAALAAGASPLPPGAAALLVPVLSLAGNHARAAEIVDGFGPRARRLPRGGSSWGSDAAAGQFEDPVSATAEVVRTLVGSGAPGTEALADRGVRFLLDSRRGAGWGSARRTAIACTALLAVARARGRPEAEPVGVRIRVGDAIAASARLDAATLTIRGVTVRVTGDYFRSGRNRIGLEATGRGPLDWSLRLLAGMEPEALGSEARGITVGRETRIVRREGSGVRLVSTESAVARGELLLTSVVVASEVPRRRVLVTVPVAGGARPVPGDAARLDPSWSPPRGVRTRLSDRAVTFFLPELGTEPVRLLFLSRATASGRFTALPAEARLADDPRVSGACAEEILYVE